MKSQTSSVGLQDVYSAQNAIEVLGSVDGTMSGLFEARCCILGTRGASYPVSHCDHHPTDSLTENPGPVENIRGWISSVALP